MDEISIRKKLEKIHKKFENISNSKRNRKYKSNSVIEFVELDTQIKMLEMFNRDIEEVLNND